MHPLLRLNRVFARLEARHWVADDMLALTFRVNGNARRWRPGQHVQLHQTVDGVRLGRSYSLTAVHADGRVELAIKRQPGGRLSNRLLDFLEVGTRVEMGQAEGELRWPPGPMACCCWRPAAGSHRCWACCARPWRKASRRR